jgi:hypothetical protein
MVHPEADCPAAVVVTVAAAVVVVLIAVAGMQDRRELYYSQESLAAVDPIVGKAA